MKKMYLKDIAHGRSGNKGNISNICVYARREEDYPFLKKFSSKFNHKSTVLYESSKSFFSTK